MLCFTILNLVIQLEIEKITQRRRQREDERRLIQEEKDRQLRLTDIQQLGDWETRETQFHLEQARKRAEIRIRDNRAEPIDLLAIHLKLSQQNSDYSISGLNIQQFDEDFSLEIDMKEPFLIFDNLPLHKVESLQKDIRMYLTLEQNHEALDFWNSLMIVCEDKLEELRASDLPLLSRVPEEVMDKIHKMLVDKNLQELDSLEKDIEIKLTSSSQINTDFWDQVLKSLKIWRAKLKLRIRHDELIEKRLEQLRVKQLRDAEIAQRELELSLKESRENPGQHLEIQRCQSPELFRESSLPSGFDELKVIDPIEDFLHLQELRKSIVNRVYVPKKFVKQTNTNEKEQDPDDLAQKQVIQNTVYIQLYTKLLLQLNELVGTRQIDHNDMELNEEVFDTELALPATSYNWEDKYRPRKPKYVNRVHTGYEWNKYNQTHYDVDNPPPRIVQGYKFNIFYPDLINQPSAKVPPPTYVIQKDPDSSEDNVEETEIIRFCAGPPYEDLAFKIVKRPWEKSHKMGFKSSFDRGVLQLHFFFKRQFYRRQQFKIYANMLFFDIRQIIYNKKCT